MARILLIEDEAGIGEALEYQLAREGHSVTWVQDGNQGLDAFRREGPDLVLLDLMLPGMSGEEVCRTLRSDSDVPVIMLTAKDEEIDKVLGLELGADDYVTKPFSTRELNARIKAVLRRGRSDGDGTGGTLEGGGIVLDPERFEVTIRGQRAHVPLKEFELLEVLMSNPGRAMTRRSLISQVWGDDYVGDTRTLDVHIKRLRAKCEIDPHSPVNLVTVRGVGYKFDP